MTTSSMPLKLARGMLFLGISVALVAAPAIAFEPSYTPSGGGGGGSVSSVFGRTGAVVADPGDYSAYYQSSDTELSALAGLTSAADSLPYFTNSGAASLATYTSFARTLDDDADAAAARSTLGLATRYTNTSTSTHNTAATNSLATGLECTGLSASSTYLVRVWGRASASVSTAGIRWRIGDGTSDNDGSGAVQLTCRGSGVGTSDAVFNGTETPGAVNYCLGTALPTSSVGAMFTGSAIWTTDASPSSIGVYFTVEAAEDGKTITVQPGGVIECLEL